MDLERFCQTTLTANPDFQEMMNIVRANSSGKTWLIGGYLFRNLAAELYGIPRPVDVDLDVIAEKVNSQFVVPDKWNVRFTRFGGPRFAGERKQIDLVAADKIHPLNEKGLPFTIENYLAKVPLTVQSIAYDLDEERLLGRVGIEALLGKTVGINNVEEAEWYSRQLGKTPEELLREKAASLGFELMTSCLR